MDGQMGREKQEKRTEVEEKKEGGKQAWHLVGAQETHCLKAILKRSSTGHGEQPAP